MNSLQIAQILQTDQRTRAKFKGVYAANKLMPLLALAPPYCCVVNTDREGEPGTHWLAIYVPSRWTVEYYDSFAEPPNHIIAPFIDTFKHKKMNSKKVQSKFDTSCGSHTIYFLVHRCHGEHFDTIVKRLTDNAPFSDSIVKLFVVRMLEHSI